MPPKVKPASSEEERRTYYSAERIPSLTDNSEYTQWKKEINWWKFSTSVDKNSQALKVVLAMQGKPRHLATQLDPEKLMIATGLEDLIKEMDKHYLKDNTQSLFCAIDAFEKYTRPKGTSIDDYISEFTRLNRRVIECRSNSTAAAKTEVYEDGILAYKLLQQSNLSPEEQRLVRATTVKLEFTSMVEALKRTYGDGMSSTRLESSLSYNYKPTPEVEVKAEPTFFQRSEERSYGDRSYGDNPDEVYYQSNFNRPRYQGHGASNNRYNPYKKRYDHDKRDSNWQNSNRPDNRQLQEDQHGSNFKRSGSGRGSGRRSPKKRACFICQSPDHFVNQCPHNNYKGGPVRNQGGTMFFQSEFKLLDRNERDTNLVGQTLGKALLDTGACTTVCGKRWYDSFWISLSTEEQAEVTSEECKRSFNFGTGEAVLSEVRKTIPVTICGQKMRLTAHVIDNNIPLLLCPMDMKKMRMMMIFGDGNDKISINGVEEDIQVTESGHLAVSITGKKKSVPEAYYDEFGELLFEIIR